jgi:hypothetical protein
MMAEWRAGCGQEPAVAVAFAACSAAGDSARLRVEAAAVVKAEPSDALILLELRTTERA